MGTPVGWDTREPLCGENDPYGREDTANKYAKTLWQNFIAGHNTDGSHRQGGLLRMETGSYSSSTGNKTISLTNSGLTIKGVLITARGAYYPVIATNSLGADSAKLFGTTALQSGCIVSLATVGQFTVGTHDAVNAQGSTVTYDYCVWGVA